MGLLNFFKKKKKNSLQNEEFEKRIKEAENHRREILKYHVNVDDIEEPKEKESALLMDESKNQNNIVRLHFIYNQLIELYYKKRNDWDGALSECIKYCRKDIDIFPAFKGLYENNKILNPDGAIPRILSFQRLAIIYEKQGEVRKAISICEKAIDYELTDNTKGGFEGRLERLEKKI